MATVTETADCEINSVDFLLGNKFSLLPDSDKLRVKTAGPQRPPINIRSANRGSTCRQFSLTWYEKYDWLTACSIRNKVFCFYCLCFGSSTCADTFSKNGYDDMKNLSRALKRHSESKSHIAAGVAFKSFGRLDIRSCLNEGFRQNLIAHNAEVTKNREILRRLIDITELLARQELSFRAHDEKETSLNRGNFIEFCDFLASYDSVLREHLESSSVFKGTSKHVQNDLIESIAFVLKSQIQKEIQESMFFAVEVDETTDVGGYQQLVTILRFVNVEDIHFEVKERFLGFSRVTQRNAEGISAMICDNIKDFDMEKKLVNQTYDGAAVMAGEVKGVQARIKEAAPMAHFIHCAAHRLNLTLQDSCMHVTPVKQFFGTLGNMQLFFKSSPKRLDALDDFAAGNKFRLVRGSATRWNFKSRCVNVVLHRYEILHDFFDSVANDTQQWDSTTTSVAVGFVRHFEDEDFAFLLLLFNFIFNHVDVLYNVLQSKTLDISACKTGIQSFLRVLSSNRTDDTINAFSERAKGMVPHSDDKQKRKPFNRQQVAFEVIDTLKTQTEIRFDDITHLNGFNLIDNQRFSQYQRTFPAQVFEQLIASYPIFDHLKLRNELEIVYADTQNCHRTQKDLLNFIIDNHLTDILSEIYKLLLLYFTIPLTTASAERSFSSLKRIKNYLRSTMTNERLDNLAIIAIEKGLLKKIDKNAIIDRFASLKERRKDFLYK